MHFSLKDYAKIVGQTNKFRANQMQPILLGLFGEVGGVMSAMKKRKREEKAYAAFQDNLIDELGDAFWYFTALTERLGINLESVFQHDDVRQISAENSIFASDDPSFPIAVSNKVSATQEISNEAIIKIGQTSSDILRVEELTEDQQLDLLKRFARNYLIVLAESKIDLFQVLSKNSKKVESRFGKLNLKSKDLPDFDTNFVEYEQLPRQFEIEVCAYPTGFVRMRWEGVFIGDPLKDNIEEKDGFRYHDVIHLAHAAILHWSPATRYLLQRKRKSDPDCDENQDGGRAIVTEEGLAAWLFSKGKDLEWFKGHDTVSMSLLKTIQDIVRGYEVDACPMNLWEHCILQGFEVLRRVRDNGGGIVVGNRNERTLAYKKLNKRARS